MKIIITGGHLSPALSVIESLPKGIQVVFIGRKHPFEGDQAVSLEYQEISSRGIPFVQLNTGRLQRTLTSRTVPSLLKVPQGVFHAYRILQKEKPDCVLSFGGYVGLPVVIAARTLKIPVVIHEQTLQGGFSNKIASKFARTVCISWKESEEFFPKEKIVLTGNPLKREFLQIKTKKRSRLNPPMIYVTGGSAGSHEVNLLIERHLESLLEHYILVHQTGDTKQFDDFGRLSKRREMLEEKKRQRYRLYTFTSPSDAAKFMHEADLIISRSGMNTVTELLYLEKKAYLVPLMHGQKGEQMVNAQFLKKLGLAQIYNSRQNLSEEIKTIITSPKYKLKGRFDMSLIEGASERIVSVLVNDAKKTENATT